MGEAFGAGPTACKAGRLKRMAWAKAACDVLWRRSRLGLHISARGRAAFAAAPPAL